MRIPVHTQLPRPLVLMPSHVLLIRPEARASHPVSSSTGDLSAYKVPSHPVLPPASSLTRSCTLMATSIECASPSPLLRTLAIQPSPLWTTLARHPTTSGCI
ncbi:hypothetical protein C8T65DRAFT_677949 [Cerioporus squamosus]|nr:hypothetical protein C8T65DRAFT_677949 [Cerioporus squamosus]